VTTFALVAHPDHRDALEAEAREAGLWGTR
jgi:hypothetical protein